MYQRHDLKLNSRELAELLRPHRMLDNTTNIKWIALEYASLAAVIGSAMGFYFCRESWGLGWFWNVPVTLVAIVLVGALQHRLSGLGHEGAHFCLFRNRWLNELASDFLCMFPIFASTQQYRLVHTAHHQYTNDWEKDPDLTNIGESKLMDRFPMSRGEFVYNFFFRFLYPPTLLRYLWDILFLSALGQGRNPYLKSRSKAPALFGIRLTGLLGAGYFVGMVAGLASVNAWDGPAALLGVVPIAAWLGTVAVIAILPSEMFFSTPVRSVYSSKTAAAMRLGYLTVLLTGFAVSRRMTGINFGAYYLLLWALPLFTTFSYFMLLRDVYQHANADDGRLTNSRVFYSDPFTKWSVFVYGQDYHIPHHLYPAIPHYRLKDVHGLLMSRCEEYATTVTECDGAFTNHSGKPTVLDVVSTPAAPNVSQPRRQAA